jgi:hypothetical protein
MPSVGVEPTRSELHGFPEHTRKCASAKPPVCRFQHGGDADHSNSPPRPPAIIADMENQEFKPHRPCPLCGGTTFTEGALSNGLRIASGPFFQADKTGQVIPRPTIVKALACDACGHILLFRTTRS